MLAVAHVEEGCGDRIGIAEGVGRADRLVGLLGALVGAGVGAGLFGHVGRAVPLAEVAAGHLDRLAGEVRRVGSHVGDQAYPPLVGKIDSFVELLGDPHRAVGRHPQPGARGLLEGARDEGGVGAGPRPGDVDRLDRVAGLGIGTPLEADDVLAPPLGVRIGLGNDLDVEEAGSFGGGLDGPGEILGRRVLRLDGERLAANLDQIALERAVVGEPGGALTHQWRLPLLVAAGEEGGPSLEEGGRRLDVERQPGGDLPRFRRRERPDLLLALDDDPRGDTLDAAGGEPPRDLLPEDRRHLVSNDPVDDPAGLLGLDPGHVDGTGILEGALDLGLRDCVEGHPLGPERIDVENLREVPGDRLPLSIQVGGKPDLGGILGELAKLGDLLLLAVIDLVGGGEVVVEIDPRDGLFRALGGLAGEIADVADRGLDDEAGA